MITSMNKKITSILIILVLVSGIFLSYKKSNEFTNNKNDNTEIIAFNNEVRLLKDKDHNDPDNYEPVAENFCDDAQKTLQFLGYILLFVRILVPLAIISVGSFDYYKAVSTGQSDDLKKQSILLLKRVISGFIIFFIPTILNIIFNTLREFDVVRSDYEVCANCLFSPKDCSTD